MGHSLASEAVSCPKQDCPPRLDSTAIPSFEEFKASAACGRTEDPLLVMRGRDPQSIENGWAALGAELDGTEDRLHNSVEDGWAALGAELAAKPPSNWAELGAALETQGR